MPTTEIYSQLSSILSVEDLARVITSLRQDPLVWSALEREDFLRQAGEQVGSHPEQWNPGRLSLLVIGCQYTQPELQAEPMVYPGQELIAKAVEIFRTVQRTGKPPSSLREAGLVALAMRERRRISGSWTGLMTELIPHAAGEGGWFIVWRTVLACLVGFTPDPVEMLRSLLFRKAPQEAVEWVIHTCFSQPGSDEVRRETFQKLLDGLPVARQLNLLRSISLHGQEDLAAWLAGQLLIGHPAFASLRAQHDLDNIDLTGLAARALAMQQMSSFYHLARDFDQARDLLTAAENALEHWRAGISLQRIALPGDNELGEDPRLDKLPAGAGWVKNELGAALVSYPYAGALAGQADALPESPFWQIRRAALMFDRAPALARDLARQGAAGVLTATRQGLLPFPGEFLTTWKPEEALRILIRLGLAEEAFALSQAFLALRPGDTSLLTIASQVGSHLGRMKEAIQSAQHLTALDPLHIGWQRSLAALWGRQGDWQKAFAQWQTVLTLETPARIEDRVQCAQAGLRAGSLSEATALIEAILGDEPNNGAALSLMGQALIAQGDIEQAASYLVRATLLAPESLDAWMALASAQQSLGETQRAIDTLRAATTAIPDAWEPPLALGRACLERGTPSEALPYLRKAFQLAPAEQQAVLLYGRALRILGHTNDARFVLERVREAWSSNPELAYEYALVLLDRGDAENALPVLEMALMGGLRVMDAYLLYVKILMGEYRKPGEVWDPAVAERRVHHAEQALRKITELDPNNLEARFLMADLLREKGELESALELYCALSETTGLDEPDLLGRVKWGLGRTALRLGQMDTALVALNEASQLRPDSLPLKRLLAEASQRANLPKEARESADFALQLAPSNIENLTWYACFMAGLGEVRKAAEALAQAIQIEPERADLWVSLADQQVAAGDLDEARKSLEAAAAMDTARSEDMRRAAHIYLRLENPPAALACYERAVRMEGEAASTDLLYEAAQLYARLGDAESALDLAQKAVAASPAALPIYLLQADLLARLNRPQAALGILETAQAIAAADVNQAGMLGEVYERFTRLMLMEGSLPQALSYAEKALELAPNSARLCYRAAHLALALMENERAGRLVRSLLPGNASPAALLSQEEAGLDLFSLQIEMALHNGQVEEAAGLVEAGLSYAEKSARLLAARARVSMRKRLYREAREQYHAAASMYQKTTRPLEAALWLAEAALETCAWKEALPVFERYVQANPVEPRAFLSLSRALVLSAEAQRTALALDCRACAPGKDALGEARRKAFTEAIQAAGKLANTAEIFRWQARGEAVFNPSAQSARALAALPAHPEDTAALVMALRASGNTSAAIQVARRHIDAPRVLLQLALCYLERPCGEAMEAASRAVNANPNDPFAHTAAARIAWMNGDLPAAFASIQAALALEPREPAWQDMAGDLAIQLGYLEQAIACHKQAVDLDPNQPRYAFKLGQACLSKEDPAEAIAYLERSVALGPDQADAWLALAGAYHIAGRMSQAMEAARRAGDLNPSSAESLVIAGETALSMGNPELALEYSRGAVRREPENASAVLFLSSVLTLREQYEESLSVIESASPVVRQVFPVAFERAKLIHRLHGARAALDILEKLAREYSEEAGLLTFLAEVQAECGETKLAERYAFKSLRLDPNQPSLTLMLGRLQRQTGQLDQAVYLLSEAIRIAPGKLENYLELASVYRERHEYPLALQVYRQAMRVAPEDFQAYYQSAMILRDSKDYAAAETMLRKAADLAPDNLSIRRQLVGVIALNLVHQNKQEATIS